MTTNKLIAILALVIFVGCVIGSFFLGRASVAVPEISTVIERDTASYDKPAPDTVEKITTVYIRVPERVTAPKDDVADSVSVEVVERDSSEVAVDIERKVYEDERYKATISGPRIGEYSPMLESIDIYTQTEVRVVEQPKKMIQPFVGATFGKDIIGIGGGVVIKQRVGLEVKYMRIGNINAAAGEVSILL